MAGLIFPDSVKHLARRNPGFVKVENPGRNIGRAGVGRSIRGPQRPILQAFDQYFSPSKCMCRSAKAPFCKSLGAGPCLVPASAFHRFPSGQTWMLWASFWVVGSWGANPPLKAREIDLENRPSPRNAHSFWVLCKSILLPFCGRCHGFPPGNPGRNWLRSHRSCVGATLGRPKHEKKIFKPFCSSMFSHIPTSP